MFNAYFDDRPKSNGALIRILSFIDRVDPTVKTFCQFWYEEIDDPLIVAIHEYKALWLKHWDVNKEGSTPFLISYRNPLPDVIPLSVSLVEHPCDQATNNLEVIYNQPNRLTKKPFAVCTKDLDFLEDQSTQVIEWIEILSILGADKVFIYVVKIHPNMMRTLRYYETQGKVKIEMMTEPKGLPNRNESLTQWLQNELISLNDCLYKHMYEYDFLLPLDIDEIITPIRDEDKNWKDLMVRTAKIYRNIIYPSFQVHNVFFLTDNNHEGEVQAKVPAQMFFLQHIYRAVNFSRPKFGSKAFQSTKLVIAAHNHFPMACLDSENDHCEFRFIPKEDAQLNHYRRDCENYAEDECEDFKKNTVRDAKLWKFKDELIERVKGSLKALNTFEG